MSKSDLDLFKVDISEEEIAEAFSDEQWENDIADAAFIGAVYLSIICILPVSRHRTGKGRRAYLRAPGRKGGISI